MPSNRFGSNQPHVSVIPSTVWLFISSSGKQWIDVTAAGLSIDVVMDIFERSGADIDLLGGETYHVQNLTVGGPLRLRRKQPLQGDIYFNDGRKFYSNGEVSL
jgi:hypothetical protein